MLLLLALLAGCDGYRGPDCEEVAHSDVVVDTTSTPVISWSGDRPNGLTIWEGAIEPDGQPFDSFEAAGPEVWSLECQCTAEVDDPGSNVGCRDAVDIDFRACLSPGITYGEVPATEVGQAEETSPAVELESGQTYSASIVTYCTGDRMQDPEFNGGDPYHPRQAYSWTTFVMP